MIKKTFIFLALVIFTLTIFSYFYLQNKKPVREGEIALDSLRDRVTISYDIHGIPHIYASNDSDLYYAFGYVHAQDRLFQMELSRRLSQGKLAEIFGEELIGVDKLFRTLGLEYFANKWIKEIEDRAPKTMLSNMQHYLDGVNAFVDKGTTPIEFDLIGIEKHHYTLEDIATISGFMAFSFAEGLKDDSLVQHLSQKLGEDYLKDLGISYTPNFEKIPVDPIVSKEISVQVSQVIESLQFGGLFHGSNSWVLSADRSESGKAMLVNDPHIAFSQPSVWYEAQLTSDNTEIYGHFLGLVPLPMLGMTKEHAWGLTMFENDDMDLYAEKINPENNNQYWAIDHWKDFEVRKELIKVRDGEDINLEVKITRHGPVVNNIFESLEGGKYAVEKATQPVSLWWAFLNTDNQMMEAFYELPSATSIEKAKNAASKIHAPGLNVMFANEKGDIGWWASAKLPIRPEHVNSKFVLDGASGKDDILGFYDFNYNPQQVNPESGVLYSANNQPDDMGNGLVPGYYSPTDRPSRIVELLSKKKKFNAEDMKKMLMDNTTPTAKLFQQISIPVISNKLKQLNKIEKQAFEYYSDWQANHSPNEIGATLSNRFRMALMRLAMEDEIGEELYINMQFRFFMARSIWRILENETSPWWDNIKTEEVEKRDELVFSAWKETVKFLRERFGDDISQWTWKNDIKMIHEHPLGKVAYLEEYFNVGPLPSESGLEAINNLMFIQEGDDLKVMMGPSTRRVIDFGNIENSWGINPTGQSGVVTDSHYSDQAEDYSKGMFRKHYITKESVKNNLKSELTLVPVL